MSSSATATSAEEALKRAREVAAKLAGKDPSSNGTSSAESSTSTTGKRKRWGVMPETAAAPTAPNPAFIAALSASNVTAIDNSNKRPKEEEDIQKRIWVRTSEERPASHYVSFFSRCLPSIQEQVAKSVSSEDDKQVISIGLEGRGASNKPTIPGMPEQPLHVLLSGKREAVQLAAPKVEQALLDAQEAPPEGAKEEDLNQSLTVIPTRGTGVASSYRPASVAQLIGQANLPPEMMGANGDEGDLITEEIGVPHGVVGYIIGRGGENIAQMQARTGCKVQIQKEGDLKPGQTERMITLSATSQVAIDECREKIQSMVQERVRFLGGGGMGGGGASGGKDSKIQEAIEAGHVHIQVEVPDADVGLVIGKQGSTIRMLQDQTGANIQVPPGDKSGNDVRIVHITHPTETGANAAKEQIEELLRNKRHTGPQAPLGLQETIQIPIPDKDVGLCIGRQGCVIRHMQSVTNTRIQIPSQPMPGQTHRIATVTGTREATEQVRQMIEQIVAEQSSASILPGSGSMGGRYNQQQPYIQQSDPQGQAQSAEWAAYHAAQAAAQQQQQQYTAAAPVSQTAPSPAPTAPNTYHEQFFRYAYYYGEAAARNHYGAWSPPEGTPNPYGTNPAGIQPVPNTANPSPAPAAAASAPSPTPAAVQGEQSAARETSRRKVSNLPAWMTKG